VATIVAYNKDMRQLCSHTGSERDLLLL